ncbi:hypothetical protein B0T21DRAFT_290351 [Apiosordaria backusii]|uniref:DNA polymerase n=1 Tax=Apiosordaria backusii TaxID=314023 RepID=A0AA40EEM8_9PEZI|nr:hypothetical protein B0T21DRAFT_290351 [Apiosordaria backusii]
MPPTLDFPVIFLLPSHFGSDELQELEEQIPTLTYDINEAEVVLGKISRKERALFELRKRKLVTEEVDQHERTPTASPPPKRIRLSSTPVLGSSDIDSDTCSEGEIQRRLSGPVPTQETTPTVKVVKLSWFTDSISAGKVLPLDDNYVVYRGRKVMQPPPAPDPVTPTKTNVLKRAHEDSSSPPSSQRPRTSSRYTPNNRNQKPGSTYSSHPVTKSTPKRPALLRQSTSEHDLDTHLPPIPPCLHTTYSCQRSTPANPPNQDFISILLKIRLARTLTGDKIGVRAYSSAIATVAAYPYKFQTQSEVARLPGCGQKIAQLYQEFKSSNSGTVKEAEEYDSDPKLQVLKQFYDIWGVAETTAREFYNKGWRGLDDVVEYGWDGLTRVQQIGVKYYDEFLLKIPSKEVEEIGEVILSEADRIEKGFEMVIVGGYRRGKKESGDVDVVLSHPEEKVTRGFVEKIVIGLERRGYITHTLLLSTANTERGQEPVAWKGDSRVAGSGFDTLDKALVVWQDPNFTGEEGGEEKKNPNPHRRVDIIISPWKTAGCAVLGWTSGTTFQRDLRRYCKREKQLKFDSSGVRSRKDGGWVDLESDTCTGEPAPDMLTAEKRVFEGLGLEWREPWERCTN